MQCEAVCSCDVFRFYFDAIRTQVPFLGGKTLEQCECIEGYWREDSNPITEGCKKCPEGGICHGGDSLPYAKNGYYSSRSKPYDFFECLSDEICSGETERATN